MSESKLSYYKNEGMKNLEDATIGQLLDRAAEKFHDKDAIIVVHQDKRFTFSELKTEVDKLVNVLLNLGVKHGDFIGIWSPNCIEWIIITIATAKIGAVLVGLDPMYKSGDLKHALTLTDVKVLIMYNVLRSQRFYDVFLQAFPDIKLNNDGTFHCDQLKNLTHVIVIGSSNKHIANNEYLVYDELLTKNYEAKEIVKTVETHDVSNIFFTSGTTGRPKAAMSTHFKLINNTNLFGVDLGFFDRDYRVCVGFPFFHVAGFMSIITGLNSGATLVLPSLTYSPSKNYETLIKERCNVFMGSSTMIADLINENRKNDDEVHLDLIVSGGALLPEELFKEIKKNFANTDICNIYGMTESSGATFHTDFKDEINLQCSTVGRLMQHWEAKVINKDGNMVPFGSPGELCVRGFGVIKGYYKNVKATEDIITEDKWLKTGDLFILYESGHGSVVGRIKDIIIRGGENISPLEVEDLLLSHPDIMDACVYGVPDKRLGEIVCASIRLWENCEHLTSDQGIHQFCLGKIAPYKIPVYTNIVQEFPKTTSGKIKKYELAHTMIEKLSGLTFLGKK